MDKDHVFVLKAWGLVGSILFWVSGSMLQAEDLD